MTGTLILVGRFSIIFCSSVEFMADIFSFASFNMDVKNCSMFIILLKVIFSSSSDEGLSVMLKLCFGFSKSSTLFSKLGSIFLG